MELYAVAEISAIIGSAAAVGEADICIHADTLCAACKRTSDTGHDLLDKGPDG